MVNEKAERGKEIQRKGRGRDIGLVDQTNKQKTGRLTY